jgi:hypothetical protein
MLARGITVTLLAIGAQAAGATQDPATPPLATPPAADAGSAAQGPAPIAPFAAQYTADWKSINVGTSDIVLRPDAATGSYLYTWTMTARGIFRIVYSNDVIQKSWFTVHDGHVRPERYRAEQGDSNVDIFFDWTAGRARGVAETKPVSLKFVDGTQDVMSIQIEVMLDLASGSLPGMFRILDRDEIKEFMYTQEGTARIRTALGLLDTVVVASQRPGNSRVLRMWFAPSLGFVPVLAERSRDGKLEFAMRIRTLKR